MTAPETSLKSKAINGAAWTLGSFVLSNILRLGSNLILTRLLFPEVFGLISLVMTFLQGLAMFSDVGIGLSVVQNAQGDQPRFRNTVFTLQVLRGGLLWTLCWAIAWPLSRFYEQASLLMLIPAIGLTALIAGFESTAIHMAQRNLRLKPIALLELVSGTLGSLTTIALAFLHREFYGPEHPGAVWAMVVGMVAGSLLRTFLSHATLPDKQRHRFELDRDAFGAIIKVGRWVFVSSALTFFVGQSDRLIFAKMIPLSLFGVYGIAALLAGLPLLGIGHVARSVAFPAYSRMAHSDLELKRVFTRTRLPLLLGGGTLVSGLIACGPLLIRILYDSRYEEAGWILQLLTLSTWFQLMETGNSMVTLAQGRTNWMAAGNATKLLGLVAFAPLGYHLGGFPGALVGIVGAEFMKYVVSDIALAVRGLRALSSDLLFTGLVAGTAYSGIATDRAIQALGHGEVAAFFGAGSATAALWGVVALLFWWKARRPREETTTGLTPTA